MVTAEPLVVAVCCERPEPASVVELEKVASGNVRWLLVSESMRGRLRTRWADAPGGRRLTGVERASVPSVAAALTDALATLPDVPRVVLAVDRLSQRALHLLRDDLADAVVVATAEHAARAHRLFTLGRSATEVTHPVPAELRPEPETGMRVDDSGHPGDAPWMRLEQNTLSVDVAGLGPAHREAIDARRGLSAGGREDQRLLIAPANYAGQGWAWARAVRRHLPSWDARTMAVYSDRARLRFDADAILTVAEWDDPSTRLQTVLSQVVPASHVLVEAMRPVLGSTRVGAPSWGIPEAVGDVAALLESGREVALLFHGSEVRRPSQHAAGIGWSPFRAATPDPADARLDAVTAAAVEAAAELGLPAFVSTPDLLDYVPDATWLPLALLPADFAPFDEPFPGRPPVVLHAPSSSRLKGSLAVDAALRDLHARGVITYRRLTDLSPMLIPAALREADVVVDQVVLGNPGVLAAQALAAGRVVVAHLPEHVRARYPSPPPIVEATPLSLRGVILDLVADQDSARAIGAQGPAFARTLHDGRKSAQTLADAFLLRARP